MLTLNDFSFLIVTRGTDLERLSGVYNSVRTLYPDNEIVLVYDGVENIKLNPIDKHLIEVYSSKRVYVGAGYNLALKNSTKKCFVFIHDDTFIAKNFLENIIPNLSERQFCNFTTIEPPIYNDPDTILKPIKDFGRSIKTFNINDLYQFYDEHVKNISTTVVDSPCGGFFMAGFKSSMELVGGFDEYFQPYFHEDADLMLRLHQQGIRFVQVLNSIVYHMGSLTSRGTKESDESMKTTAILFIKKWKTTWEYVRSYTLENNIEYKRIPVEIVSDSRNPQLLDFISLINEPRSDTIVTFNESQLTRQDFEYLQSLPYVLQQITEDGEYQLGSLTINHIKGRYNV
jgi:GT2 family glycosyltransferase